MDAVDQALIRALQENARTPFAELARAVGMSAPSVLERVRRLERSGVITGYRVTLDPAAVGLGITAMVSIWQTDNSDVDVVADELAEVPEIEDCWMVAGDENFVVLVRVAAMADLTSVVSRIRRCPGVSRTRTTVVLASCWEGRSSIAREPAAEPGEWQPTADLEIGD